ncbi:unnamed protein product [Effrenium voratum]|uniref:Major facilitator superfamily (MFS) profile domain-containing protein n=1 Tax=Effrenium voratum TaxID=2562239 RepID=A0AA36N6F1_9DINO|nr:unnamed protein product [Effrenium voratum]CAJ1394219.1 unnamed protein product [Effrenium voratum]CAJ1433879.1 unnamed protein product [Effrenium voratum]
MLEHVVLVAILNAALSHTLESHVTEAEVRRQPLMRRHSAIISPAGVISPEVEFPQTWPSPVASTGSALEQARQPLAKGPAMPSLWLGLGLSSVGVLATLSLLRVRRVDIASEESLPPRPGSVSSSLQMLGITSLNVAYGAMISTMAIFVLPKEAEHFFPRQSSLGLGLLELLGAFSLLCGPVAGQMSDRQKHPLGRRRPMVLVASQLAVASTIGCWLASLYGYPVAFSVCLLVQQIAWNCAHAAHNALLSDIIHPTCTGLASSLQTISLLVGGMVGMLAFQGLTQQGLHHSYVYGVQAALTYLFLPLVHLTAREASSQAMLLPSDPVSMSTVFRMGEDKSPDFVLVMWERGVYYVASGAKSFLLFFARDTLNVTSVADQALLLAQASVAMVGTAALGGLLSSVLFTRTSIQPQKVACAGSVILAVACQFWVCPYFEAKSKAALLGFFTVYGFGKGCYMSADLALAIDTMPDPDEASRYLGLWGVSAFLGAGLGGFAMSLMLEVFGKMLPESYGTKVKNGTYCIQGYVTLLLACTGCHLYVAHLCLRIRTRRQYEQQNRSASERKTNAFLVSTPPNDKERWSEDSKPEDTSNAVDG